VSAAAEQRIRAAARVAIAVLGAAVVSPVRAAPADAGDGTTALADRPPGGALAGPDASARRRPSGLAALTLRPGTGGRRPQPSDLVTLRYVAWDRSGARRASFGVGAPPAPVSLRALVRGLAEGVGQMVSGERDRLWIPSKLVFAGPESQDDDDPVPDVDLIVDVELLAVTPGPRPPPAAELSRPPRGVLPWPSGVTYRRLRPGTGSGPPPARARVTLNYVAWTAAGVLVESTLAAGRPVVALPAELVPGLREGIGHMRVGEKARLWIPADQAYGEHPRRGQPKGPLVYDVELVDFRPLN
jgi:peptidylprolyl isomerase